MTADMQSTLRQIACHGCSDADPCWCWDQDDDAWVFVGESADGAPDWRVSMIWNSYLVQRKIGWYVQRGDAKDAADLLRVARAMDAASRALNDALDAEGDQ
jgi:hypothetical protein